MTCSAGSRPRCCRPGHGQSPAVEADPPRCHASTNNGRPQHQQAAAKEPAGTAHEIHLFPLCYSSLAMPQHQVCSECKSCTAASTLLLLHWPCNCCRRNCCDLRVLEHGQHWLPQSVNSHTNGGSSCKEHQSTHLDLPCASPLEACIST